MYGFSISKNGEVALAGHLSTLHQLGGIGPHDKIKLVSIMSFMWGASLVG